MPDDVNLVMRRFRGHSQSFTHPSILSSIFSSHLLPTFSSCYHPSVSVFILPHPTVLSHSFLSIYRCDERLASGLPVIHDYESWGHRRSMERYSKSKAFRVLWWFNFRFIDPQLLFVTFRVVIVMAIGQILRICFRRICKMSDDYIQRAGTPNLINDPHFVKSWIRWRRWHHHHSWTHRRNPSILCKKTGA